MTLAYWCVLVAAYLPLLWTGLAKYGPRYDNTSPREYLEKTSGWRKRAHWAQLNGFEAFPPFAVAVIIAHLLKAPQPQIDLIAGAFIVCRVLHGLFYVIDRATLRSLVWIAGVACVVALFVIAAASP